MKSKINGINRSGPQVRRKSVAQILRDSYERFSNDPDSLIALKAVLR
jgi:hypothetical protein